MFQDVITNDEVNRFIRNRPMRGVVDQHETVKGRVGTTGWIDVEADHCLDLAFEATECPAHANRVVSIFPAPTPNVQHRVVLLQQCIHAEEKQNRSVDVGETAEPGFRVEFFNEAQFLYSPISSDLAGVSSGPPEQRVYESLKNGLPLICIQCLEVS